MSVQLSEEQQQCMVFRLHEIIAFSGMLTYLILSCRKHETCALLLLAVELILAPSFGVFLC